MRHQVQRSSTGCGCGSPGCAGCAPVSSSCTSGTEETTELRGEVANPCLAPRPRYFPGQLISDFDLAAAVTYHRSHELLANRAIGGWGVYCGYSIEIDANNCRLIVGPGVAFDAKGRPLVSGKQIELGRPDLADVNEICDPCEDLPEQLGLYLGIVYDDCLDAAKPRYATPCGPTRDPGCDYSRIQERARFVWLKEVPAADHPFWITGCLPDPCAETDQEEDDCTRIGDDCSNFEPALDRCTPDIGIRGASGVNRYASALAHHWNLHRNAQLIADGTPGVTRPENSELACCDNAVAAMIDVISGVACQPCRDTPIVLLAHVVFGNSDRRPALRVSPIRRRVLSNADLTYLLTWLLERHLCGPRQVDARPTPPPDSRATCTDPCEPTKARVEQAAYIAVGNAPKLVMEAARKEAAWEMIRGDYKRVEDLPIDKLAVIHRTAVGEPPQQEEIQRIELRRATVLGAIARRPAAEKALAIIDPEIEDPKLRDQALGEIDKVLERVELPDIGRLSWADGIAMAEKVYEVAKKELTREVKERIGRYFPDFHEVERDRAVQVKKAKEDQVRQSFIEAQKEAFERFKREQGEEVADLEEPIEEDDEPPSPKGKRGRRG